MDYAKGSWFKLWTVSFLGILEVHIWIIGFTSIWQMLRSIIMKKGNLNLKKCPHRPVGQACGNWWLMWDVPPHDGQCQLWASGPGWYIKANWASLGEQGSKRAWRLHGEAVPALSPCPNTLHDGLQAIRWNKHFLPQLTLVTALYH